MFNHFRHSIVILIRKRFQKWQKGGPCGSGFSFNQENEGRRRGRHGSFCAEILFPCAKLLHLSLYGNHTLGEAEEEKIAKTARKSRKLFFAEAEMQPSSYFDFLYQQAGYVKKRWWLLQAGVLLILWWSMHEGCTELSMQRGMGILAPVFVVLLIPELWKNRSSQTMEIETAAYYSLRQIYAARMLIHFFVPLSVTCGILFGVLCSKYIMSEFWAVFLTLLWSAVWLVVVVDNHLYQRISLPAWEGMLCTLLHPTEGRIYYNGADIFEMGAEYRKVLGYLPQEFGYYPDFTVKDYLLYIASIKGVSRAAASRKVMMMLDKVGLSKIKNRKMKKLSGGMKRRVGIAQAMLNDPEILILDEPTAGLDPSERIRFRNLISELARERLMMLSTHIVSDIESIANEILLMKDGEILHAGTLKEVTENVEEKVFHLTVPLKEADYYRKTYKVVNIRTGEGMAHM